MVAISPDETADASRMAKKYGIGYSLLPEPSNAAAKAFGVYDAEVDLPRPAMFLVGSDGRVKWRFVSSTTAERIYVAELLPKLRRILGRSPGRRRGGYLPGERWQLQVEALVGAAFANDEAEFEGRLGGVFLAPVASWLALGAGLGFSAGDAARADLRGVARLRYPYYSQLGNLYLDLRAGPAVFSAEALRGEFAAQVELGLGTQFAPWPGLAFAVDLSASQLWWRESDETQTLNSVGLRLAAIWLFR